MERMVNVYLAIIVNMKWFYFPFIFLRINDISGSDIYLEIINRKTYIEFTLKNDVYNRKSLVIRIKN